MATVFQHCIPIFFGLIGLIVSNVLLDAVDHTGTWRCKAKFIFKDYLEIKDKDCTDTVSRGILHTPVVMMSMFAFAACFALGILMHLIMDFVKFYR